MDFKDVHFKMIFWYLVVLSAVIMCYDFGITFFDISEKSIRFADGHSSSFTNILIAIVSFFTGAAVGTISKKKPDQPDTRTNTNPQNQPEEEQPGGLEGERRMYGNRATNNP